MQNRRNYHYVIVPYGFVGVNIQPEKTWWQVSSLIYNSIAFAVFHKCKWLFFIV